MRTNSFSSLVSWALLAALSLFILAGAAFAADGDVPNSADYPGIGRFEGSVLTGYDTSTFDEYWLATGPVAGREHGDGLDLEGKVVRIAYDAGTSPSVLEVARNFEMQLQEAGYEILYACRDKDCGGYNFRYYGTEVLPIPQMVVNLDDFRYVAAHKGGSYVAVLTSINNGRVLTQLIGVETGEMADSMVDASKMASSISETGKVALYGIHFDYDSAAIKPESRPALDQIAGLMKDNPDLEILVVGHTDNQGSFDYNMALSTQRARAIVKELVSNYGIAAARLTPYGASFMAPVASNRTEDGRAQNRRVELVQR